MAAKGGERTASSATRFTATTPHASSKLGSGAPKAPTSRFAPAPGTGVPRKPVESGRSSAGAETPEQRVARLRAAHEAAKNAKISRFDSILARARPFFDSAHRITVIGLVGLTAVAGLMTAYTAYDMLRLEAARLAYMRGDATDEQMSLIEQANARPEGFQLPSILSAPKPIAKTASEEIAATGSAPEAQPEEKKSGLWGLFSSGSKKESQDAAAEKPQPRSLDEKRAMLESARAAFEQEKENQRKGGPLDRLGTEESTPARNAEQPKKKGWLW
ncbi:hypothetical protein N0V93_002762 [Gnomoniopsis smithogilvyi]|uniref:Uncharacterized protein n=1 Tax=Gnomoniopsis smithogilvyi TaxID=1191159 RepID=A0A9W9CXY8_9PEZI|nr:hypothetical protein N0V93_002762 [Gnomoniopsis smithogilvyi]